MVGDLAGFHLGGPRDVDGGDLDVAELPRAPFRLLAYHRDVSFLLALIVPPDARPGLGKKGHRPGPRYRLGLP
jgi:hypothetical protein